MLESTNHPPTRLSVPNCSPGLNIHTKTHAQTHTHTHTHKRAHTHTLSFPLSPLHPQRLPSFRYSKDPSSTINSLQKEHFQSRAHVVVNVSVAVAFAVVDVTVIVNVDAVAVAVVNDNASVAAVDVTTAFAVVMY